MLVILFFAYALSWGFAYHRPLRAQRGDGTGHGVPLIFPLLFASSAFVPVASMPGWLQVFAEHQPVTQVVNASRSLMVGGTLHDPGAVWSALLWSAASWSCSPRSRCASTARWPEAGRYSSPVRRRSSPSSSAMGTRTWSVVSRSRTVTALSSSESKSTVTHHGVPTSSWRR